MHHRLHLALASAAVWLSTAGPAHAIIDPSGDFLPTFTGTAGADLDVLSASVTYDPGADLFTFSGSFGAAVGTTPGGFYVWGLDRGTGTERFNSGALPVGAGVLFDSVVILRPDGTGAVNRFDGAPSTLVGAVTVSGSTLTGVVAGSLLPSTGFDKLAYTWNLWPRDGAVTGNAAISDFAPDASNASVTAVPEPSTYALMLAGLGVVGWIGRRRALGRPLAAR